MSGEVVLLSLDKSFNKVQYLLGLFSLRLSYKSGPKDDPTNYRGITIGSALGK
jgi:hypothetical protein